MFEKIALNNIQIKGTDVVTPDVTKLDLDLSFTGDVSEISLMFKNYETNSSFAAYVQDIKGNPLRVGKDITQNHKNMDLSKSDVSHIYTTISNAREKDSFYKNMNNFRNRYKK